MASNTRAYISIGHLAPDPAWAMKSHRHPFHELIVVIRGTMTVQMDRQNIVARGGDVLFYPRGVPHQEQSDPRDPVESFFMAWRGAVPPRRITHDSHGRIRVLIQWLYEERLSAIGSIDELRHTFLRAILAEMDRLARNPEPDELVRTVRTHIQNHLAEPLTLDYLARQAGLSKFHFLRRYRQLTGRTPIQDLQAIRMEAARNLLMTTDLPLKAIATKAGLCNPYYLCRLFRRHFGTTPTAFRGKYARQMG